LKKFILQRMFESFFSLFGLIAVVFFLVRMTGNPADLYLPENATQEMRAEFTKMHGLDDPVMVQFARYTTDLLKGDLGQSMRQGRPAFDIVIEAYPTSLQLAVVTMVLGVILATIIGVIAAFRPTGLFDRITTIISLGSASAPNFWVALTLISVFSVAWRLLPTSGTGGFLYWIMPITVLILRPIGVLAVVVREAMMTALGSPYIRTARAKGAHEKSILFVHALRNASLPIVTTAGTLAVGFVNGSVIVETIYGWPGIGKLMIYSILQRDFAVVQAAVVVTAIVIFALNIVIDTLYAAIDPRIRY
jgi:peptide/nickel transport system permease protein